MKIGIISEGHSDRAVIVNILEGAVGIDISDIIPILPIYALDETDLANKKKQEFGGWPAVKKECEEKEFINLFFEREGDNFIVIHFDTAECAQYGVKQPAKNQENYAAELRKLVVKQVGDWMKIDDTDSFLFAIAIEEMDAWILAILEDRDSTSSANPKAKLEYLKGFRKGKMKPDYDLYLSYSEVFKTGNKQQIRTYLSRNQSLNEFCQEVIKKVAPKLQN